jgi:hypothetical protein
LAASEATLEAMNGLVRALDGAGIEANLLSVPFCHVDEANQANAVNEQQFFLDHQHYISSTYELVQDIRRLGSSRMQMTIENLLTRRATLHHLIDNALLPWIMGKPRYYVRVWMLHKLTRHLKFFKRGPRPLPETVSACEAQVEQMRLKRARDLGNECGRCRFQRICDHMPRAFKEAFPGIQPKAIEGETVLSPTHYLQNRKRFYDAVDEPRLHVPDQMIALAKEAYAITLREKATRKVSVSTYELENHFSPVDDAAVRWISYSNVHIESTVLTRLELPFTLSVTFGGGIAQHIGFSFGRHVKIMCPMIDHSHQLIFHVDKTGHFVLLRDGELIRPSEFEEAHRVPPRLAGSLEPRLAVSNVDGLLLSQAIQVWEGEQERLHDVAGVKYSVMIINSRYTRRLQAVLMALAHQVDFDMAKVEVVVCYVPGFDATDDTLDSMELAFPELRIVRSPFSEDLARSKGFMINESLHVASGEWIVLLDADIVVPPDLFAKVDAVEADAKIIAPDGRLMLSPQATARILLGQDHTWENFDGFASGATEYRYREADSIPIGFFQCVRRHILQAIPYQELDHFEGSDYVFGRDSVGNFGKEARLKGVYVLHLDHGGSQWYGTKKHL